MYNTLSMKAMNKSSIIKNSYIPVNANKIVERQMATAIAAIQEYTILLIMTRISSCASFELVFQLVDNLWYIRYMCSNTMHQTNHNAMHVTSAIPQQW